MFMFLCCFRQQIKSIRRDYNFYCSYLDRSMEKIFQPAVSWMFWLKTCGMNECRWRHAEQSWSSRRKKSKRKKAPPVLITEIEGTLNGFVKGNFKYFASKTILPWKVFFRSSKVVMSFQRHLIAFVTFISTRGKTYVQFERHYCTNICIESNF